MAQLSQLLLFDPDPSGLDTLTYGFEKEGCSVTATADAAKARDLILGANPALLVINLRDSERVGLDLLKGTTSNPRSRNLACVVIGREDFRPAAMAAGAFVFLSTPLFVRDVLGACRLVAAASVPGSRPSPDTELSLNLAELDGIYFLVRALAVTGRSAVVEVQRAPKNGEKNGELRFMDGTLTSAEMGALNGLPALHQMLLWEEAGLHFKFKNVVRRGTQLSMKSSEVIEECDRFLRDFAHEARDLGFARTVYSADAGAVRPSSDFPSEVVPVLKLFDGNRNLGQVLDDSPFRVFDTLKIIKRFVAGDAIRTNTPVPPAGRENGPTLSGPGALDYWSQKQAPVLGAELGNAIATGSTVGTGTVAVAGKRPIDGARRTPAAAMGSNGSVGVRPVVVTGARPSSPFVAVSDEHPTSERKAVVGQRTRTITQKDHLIEASNGPAPEDIPTPPPVVKASDSPPKPAVATGEIKIAVSSTRQTEPVPAEGAPSVLVEIGPLPVPMSMGSDAPVPVTANSGSPSVIIAPMTPAPVATGRPRKFTPTPGADGKRNRSPSDSFNAVESDFFEREADLYKPESVEDFGDLDGKSRTARRPNGPARKR